MNNTQGNGTEGMRQTITLAVERVTEFERKVKEGGSWRYEDPSHESRMKVGIRVGNQVAQAELRYETDWNNSDHSKRDQRIIKVYGINDLTTTLDAIGIALDWTALFAEYKPLADAWQAERKAAALLARTKSYDEGWAVKFVAHTTPQLATMGCGDMTLTATPTRDVYINDERGHSDLRVQVTYKGKSENIWVERGEYRTYDKGFKKYRAKKIATILQHIKENIDGQILSSERERQAKLVQQNNLTTLQSRFPE
jgi:hypothetical protein